MAKTVYEPILSKQFLDSLWRIEFKEKRRASYETRKVMAIANFIFVCMMHETVVDEVKIHTKLLFHSAIMDYKVIERIKKYKKVEG